MVEVFQQHGESGVLHLKFGAGEIASGLGRAAVVFRSGDFLGEAEELEGSLYLAGEVGDFGGEHGAVAMWGDWHQMMKLARGRITCHMTP